MHKLWSMTTLFAIVMLGALADVNAQDRGRIEVCTLKINGMACGACAAKVEETALKLRGVTAAKVSQPKGTAEITFDSTTTDPASIAKYITAKSGFKAEHQPEKVKPKG